MNKFLTILAAGTVTLGTVSIFAGSIGDAVNKLDKTSLNNILEGDSVYIDGDDLFILEQAIKSEKLADIYTELSQDAQNMLRDLILDEKLLDIIDAWENNEYKNLAQKNMNNKDTTEILTY